MAFVVTDLPDYDALLYEALHESMDHLIDLASRCNAHSDVLEAEESDPEDEQPSPLKMLKAQLQLNGAEEEIQETQQLIQILSTVLITRHTRHVIHHEPTPAPPCRDRVRRFAGGWTQLPPEPDAGPGAQDGSDLPDSEGQ
jgi:hypothetical protein